MARTAKTKHVLDLVGASPVKKKVPPQIQDIRQRQAAEMAAMASAPAAASTAPNVPTVSSVAAAPRVPTASSAPTAPRVPTASSAPTAPNMPTASSAPTAYTLPNAPSAAPKPARERLEQTGLPQEEIDFTSDIEERLEITEETPELPKPRITVIVTELINQELWTVLNRFNLPATDSNLWELTRTAIEGIRPEFARNEEEYMEKTERLRPRVINEMTKAAVKLTLGKREK